MPGLHPILQFWGEQLVDAAARAGANPRVTSTYRTYGQQLKLWMAARAGLSPYPAAFPGTSKHEEGLAFDVVTNNDAYWLPAMGAAWRSIGGRWFASDPIHFEA